MPQFQCQAYQNVKRFGGRGLRPDPPSPSGENLLLSVIMYSLSTITVSDHIMSKIQRLQNKFIRLALRLPKYILPKLLHDSAGLPYMKDRLLSCATQSLDGIAQNPLVEASISSNRLNPAWDCFPTPLSVIRPGSS